MNTIRKILYACMAFGCSAGLWSTHAQEMNTDDWELSSEGASFVEYMGRPALQLNNGFAILKDQQFKNGTITFDVALEEKNGFGGVYFRWNDNSAEHFYLRPHLSGKPDSTQYTTRYNGLAAWQMLHGARYSTPTVYQYNQWTPVKMVIKDRKMDIYIDSDTPSLHVENLLGPDDAGQIRLGGAQQNFRFSNIVITPSDEVETIGTAAPLPAQPENLIQRFKVGTQVIAGADVEAKLELAPGLLANQTWQYLDIDESGTANLAKISGRTRDINTLLVKMDLTSDVARTIKITYGFSDRVTVFLNGKAIAYGNDSYRSRDYRYLGTVGLYDSVYLPLKKGENLLVFAVTEGFGGWAIKAAMDPVDGVKVE